MSNLKWTAESDATIEPFNDVSLGANEDGRLEIYTYSTLGDFNINHKWQEWDAQKQNIIGLSNWDPFPGSTARTYLNNAASLNTNLFVGLTAVGDSCIQIVTQGAWGIAQKSKNGTWPDHVSRLGSGPSDQTMVTAMARSLTGALYAFGVDQGSFNIHYAKQEKAGGNWSWHTINHPKKEGGFAIRGDDWPFRSHLARTMSRSLGVGGDLDGRIEMFYGSDLRIWTIYQTAPGIDTWTYGEFPEFPGYTNPADWTVIQNDPTSQNDFAGRLEVFALALTQAGTYTLFHSWQRNSNGTTGWSGWEPIPGLGISLLPTQNTEHQFIKGPIRAARQQDGSIVIFAIAVDPQKRGQNPTSLFYIQQNGPNASFRQNWVNLDGDNILAFDIGQNIDGTLFAVINSGHQIWSRKQVNINSDNWG